MSHQSNKKSGTDGGPRGSGLEPPKQHVNHQNDDVELDIIEEVGFQSEHTISIAAPNIYYLGTAGVVRYKGLRIGGISGIYYSNDDYCMSRYETPPFNQGGELNSVYHVRNVDVFRLKSLATADDSNRIDIMLSHDWPQGIEQYGDIPSLLNTEATFLP